LIADRFFNDAFWFDQLGCSSPRFLCWIGSEEKTRSAAHVFFEHLAAVVSRRGYRVDTATAINKLTFACRAVLDQPVTEVLRLSNEIMTLRVERWIAVIRPWVMKASPLMSYANSRSHLTAAALTGWCPSVMP
jgi:hypothetical protein